MQRMDKVGHQKGLEACLRFCPVKLRGEIPLMPTERLKSIARCGWMVGVETADVCCSQSPESKTNEQGEDLVMAKSRWR